MENVLKDIIRACLGLVETQSTHSRTATPRTRNPVAEVNLDYLLEYPKQHCMMNRCPRSQTIVLLRIQLLPDPALGLVSFS